MSVEVLLLGVVASVFAVGAVVIAIASVVLKQRETVKELWQLYAVEFVLVAMVLLPFYLGGPVLLATLLLFIGRSAWELHRVNQRKGHWPQTLFYVALLCVLPAVLISDIRQDEQGFVWLFLIYAVVEVNDAFATVFGKLFGRRRPFPKLSPRKSLEGLLGGVVIALVLGVGLAVGLLGLELLKALLMVGVILLGGLTGDLLTSLIKRNRGIKDFPPVHGLHGGLLDIHDALLMSVLFFYPLYQYLPG